MMLTGLVDALAVLTVFVLICAMIPAIFGAVDRGDVLYCFRRIPFGCFIRLHAWCGRSGDQVGFSARAYSQALCLRCLKADKRYGQCERLRKKHKEMLLEGEGEER